MAQGMIDGKEEEQIGLRDLFLAASFPVRVIVVKTMGHCGNSFFDPLQKRDRTEDLPDGCGMDPDRFFEGEGWQKSHPLNQFPSKPPVDKSPEQEIRRSENKEKCEKDVVE